MRDWKTRTDESATALLEANAVDRVWSRDYTLWAGLGASRPQDEAERASIANRLGWLTAPAKMRQQRERLLHFAQAMSGAGLDSVLLLGMGGSSLCAEVLRQVAPDSRVSLRVLDTTDERAILEAADASAPARTVCLVASKSGTTIEVASLERFFSDRLRQALGPESWPEHFVAITDPGTALARQAGESHYRDVFMNPPDVGGRFSALTHFGLVPAALLGMDPDRLLAPAEEMGAECHRSDVANPGLQLGAFMGTTARCGRDKLTVFLPDSLSMLGLWIEQLVAESTGKAGVGILPIVGEPVGQASMYGADRSFVFMDDGQGRYGALKAELESSGHPTMGFDTRDLGAEFFRWEFATAMAGAVLGVNPFDEPNVQEAKDQTRRLLGEFERTGTFPVTSPDSSDDRVEIYGASSLAPLTPRQAVEAALDRLAPADYVALLSYLSPTAEAEQMLQETRVAIRDRYRVAVTVGTGPRYLHSTGQYHKGGPPRGLFFVLTASDATSTPVTGARYTFSALKQAQAIGDFQALASRRRKALRIHLKHPSDASAVRALFGLTS